MTRVDLRERELSVSQDRFFAVLISAALCDAFGIWMG
jgi:hypothetical protein